MIPLRLVLDTNLIVSAALKPDGLQRTVLLLAITKPARLYISSAILAEYHDVLSRPELRIRPGSRQQLLQLIENRARSVVPAKRLQVTSDPGDNIFLECADALVRTISLQETSGTSQGSGKRPKSLLRAN